MSSKINPEKRKLSNHPFRRNRSWLNLLWNRRLKSPPFKKKNASHHLSYRKKQFQLLKRRESQGKHCRFQ
jgi:hypothetical protein